jgi:hypothetical protein
VLFEKIGVNSPMFHYIINCYLTLLMQKSKENLVSRLLMLGDAIWLKGISFENDLNTKVCFGDGCLGGVIMIECDIKL